MLPLAFTRVSPQAAVGFGVCFSIYRQFEVHIFCFLVMLKPRHWFISLLVDMYHLLETVWRNSDIGLSHYPRVMKNSPDLDVCLLKTIKS